jgi:hypothetical protein
MAQTIPNPAEKSQTELAEEIAVRAVDVARGLAADAREQDTDLSQTAGERLEAAVDAEIDGIHNHPAVSTEDIEYASFKADAVALARMRNDPEAYLNQNFEDAAIHKTSNAVHVEFSRSEKQTEPLLVAAFMQHDGGPCRNTTSKGKIGGEEFVAPVYADKDLWVRIKSCWQQ